MSEERDELAEALSEVISSRLQDENHELEFKDRKEDRKGIKVTLESADKQVVLLFDRYDLFVYRRERVKEEDVKESKEDTTENIPSSKSAPGMTMEEVAAMIDADANPSAIAPSPVSEAVKAFLEEKLKNNQKKKNLQVVKGKKAGDWQSKEALKFAYDDPDQFDVDNIYEFITKGDTSDTTRDAVFQEIPENVAKFFTSLANDPKSPEKLGSLIKQLEGNDEENTEVNTN